MAADDLILISVDDHVIEPRDLFERTLPARHRDRAPQVVEVGGIERWTFEGRTLSAAGENALMGKPFAERRREPASYGEMRTAYYDVHERVLDMNAGGQLAALCFPTFARFAGQVFLEATDKDLALACLQAYNDWHVDEWCGAYPDRFIACGLVPLWSPDHAAAEVRRLAARGVHAVTFSENPSKLGLPSLHTDHWDPFFAACVDNAVVPCIHVGSSSSVHKTAPDAPAMVHLVVVQQNSMSAAADWVLSQTFVKFPALKVALSEGGISWIPGLHERMEHMVRWHGQWADFDLDHNPIEIMRNHLYVCFVNDQFGIEQRHRIGVDTIMWESDYPHPDSIWPLAPELLDQTLANCSAVERDQLTWANAARLYHFDPFARRPRERCTAGALRAEVAGRPHETHEPYTGLDKSRMFEPAVATR